MHQKFALTAEHPPRYEEPAAQRVSESNLADGSLRCTTYSLLELACCAVRLKKALQEMEKKQEEA